MDAVAVRENWSSKDGEHAWLEEVTGEKALEWVRARNAEAVAALGDPAGSALYRRVLSILDCKDKIPHPRKIGQHLYNFWQDAQNPRGIWRRTTFDSFRTTEPAWEVVLDVDALGRAEGVSWVWHGHTLLEEEDGHDPTRTLVALSREGADADEKREFDLVTKQFVPDGYRLPEAKSSVSWLSRDMLLVSTDFGEGSLLENGCPRTVREWRRGTPLRDARLVYEGEHSDISITGYFIRHAGHAFEWRYRYLSFFAYHKFVRPAAHDDWTELPLPLHSQISQFRDQVLVTLREEWELQGQTFRCGSLLAFDLPRLLDMGLEAPATLLFQPTPTCSLDSFTSTCNFVILELLDTVKSRLHFWKFEAGQWVDVGAEPEAAVRGCSLRAVDSDVNDAYFFTACSFTQPSTLTLVDAAAGGPAAPREVLKALPAQYNATGLVEEQLHCRSADGTAIPYFVVRRADMALDGSTPVLLYGYGGFECSMTPWYTAVVGTTWLEAGGCYVLANLRGGGEFGPAWHQAAVKENKQKSYDDFIAIAEDLIARGITSPQRLAIRGGSNGGLLVGAVMVQRPDLFGAVVCEAPLLDMRRFHRLALGATWVSEYGNPDTDDWDFIQRYSPYHNLNPAVTYPPLLVTASTRDDRVHPYHSRSFVARLLDLGKGGATHYYENIEGGHGGAADNPQLAFMTCLYISLLRRTVGAGMME
eukprot:EG_transcript_3914